MRVAIHGDGIAAWCCARLLTNSATEVVVDRGEPRKRPFILVSDPVQRLLCEIAGDEDLFRGVPRIRQRHVLWGDSPIAKLEHSAAIVEEQKFLEELWQTIPPSSGASDRTIFASKTGATHDFGTRIAWIADVSLRDSEDACWIESFERGWLFLIGGVGALIAVGAPPDELLRVSRLIAPFIAELGDVQPPVAAYPRIVESMFGEKWLACGSAAMGLDPICGDGCGHAVREAILATAVLRGGAEPAMLDHYQARLRLAFERHLLLCRSFYAGIAARWWMEETAHIDRGLEWIRKQAGHQWRYRLDALDLKPL